MSCNLLNLNLLNYNFTKYNLIYIISDMKEQLVGREKEMARLENAWNSGKFEFIVIYGRRRVGKSFLIDAFCESKNGVYYEAVDGGTEVTQLRLMSRAVSRGLYGNENLVYPDFVSILDDVAKRAVDERFFLALDEISYLCESCPEMIGLLQHYVDTVFSKTKLVLILSGSSRHFIEENVLGRHSPLYGRRTEQIKLFPFSPSETARMFPSWSIHDLAVAHVITGGIPYYQSFLARHDNILEAIHDEFFMPGSSLFTEAELFMRGIYRKIGTYESVLSQIASGTLDVSKISSKTGLSEANISAALSSLASQEIVAKKEKIAGHGLGRGWRITDGYFAFFYRYVQPYYSLIERGKGEAACNNALDSLDGFVSKHIEYAFREYVLSESGFLITSIGSIDFPNPIQKRNEEVDLFGKADDGWVVGECKWQNNPVHRDVFNLLEMRKMLLVGEDKAEYFLLSRSGFDDEMLALSQSRSDIHLITGEELFGR